MKVDTFGVVPAIGVIVLGLIRVFRLLRLLSFLSCVALFGQLVHDYWNKCRISMLYCASIVSAITAVVVCNDQLLIVYTF